MVSGEWCGGGGGVLEGVGGTVAAGVSASTGFCQRPVGTGVGEIGADGKRFEDVMAGENPTSASPASELLGLASNCDKFIEVTFP